MVESGQYFWNSGIFLFRATDLVHSFKFKPNIVEPVKLAVNRGRSDLGFWRLDPQHWSRCESISIDYAIMEKTDNLVSVPLINGWSDLGNWFSVWEEKKSDQKDGVVAGNNTTAIDCKDVLLRSESMGQELVGLGIENVIAVAMPDAVLVAKKEKAQDVRKVVEVLKQKQVLQAEVFPKYHRPWGWFEPRSSGKF